MVKLLVRCIFFIVGIALILDAALPTRMESLQVDRHTSHTETEHRTASGGDSRWADTKYTLHLIGGVLRSCSVGHAAYAELKDGDAIDVQSSKLFKTCVHISRAGVVIESFQHWKWFALIGGVVLLAAAIGWLKSDDDEGTGVSIRLG